MRVLFAILQALPAPVAAALIVLQDADKPNNFWSDNAWLFYTAIVVVGIWGVVPPVRQAMRERRTKSNESRLRSIETILGTAFMRIHEATKIPVGELGVEAYLVDHDRPLGSKALVHHGHVRLGAPKWAGGIRWTKGKGVLGTCWSTGKYAKLDYSRLAASWDDCAEHERYGITKEESKRIGYGAVAAHPIIHHRGTAVQGCVAADATSTNFDKVASDEVKKVLAEAAAAVWAIVRPSSGD